MIKEKSILKLFITRIKLRHMKNQFTVCRMYKFVLTRWCVAEIRRERKEC